jgi:hypothetical protein
MGESTSYMFSDTLQSDFIDGAGNLVHHWWSGSTWETEVIAGPDAPAGRVQTPCDRVSGVTWQLNAFGQTRLDLWAVAEDGSAQIHGYWTEAWGWNADAIPGVGTRRADQVSSGGPDTGG